MNLFYEAKKVLDKDGKVNPLGPYGKQKLTGREIQVYFRRNKVKDKVVKKAVEVALDLGGAMDIAIKSIKDYYGDKVLKAKEVQNALKFANEESFKDSFNMLDEDYKKVIKMFPRDRDWKKLITKHKKHIDAFRDEKKQKDLPKKVEDDLLGWGSQNGEVSHKDDAEDFIMSILDEKYKPYTDKTYSRCVDFYIQFRGGKGDRITSEENKKDFIKATDMIDAYCKKNKIKQKPVYSTPMEGSSAYKVGLMIDPTYSKTDDYKNGVDLQPLYVALGKLKTAEDHGGGWDKPATNESEVLEKKSKIKYRGNLKGLHESIKGIMTEGKNLMPDLQKIVDKKSATKVGGVMVDMFTASMITQIYGKVNDKNKERMEKSNISTLVDLAQRMMQKSENDPLKEGTMAIGIKDRDPKERRKAQAQLKVLLKKIGNKKVGSKEGQDFDDKLDYDILSDDELADEFANPKNKNMKVKDLLKKHSKRLNVNFDESVEEGHAVSRAQQAAIAIAKKKKNESVMDSYRQMWESENLEEKKEFKQNDIDKVAKLTDRNEHTKSLIHIAKSMGDKKSLKKLELIDKMHNEYGHMPKGLMDMRNEVYDDLKKDMEKYSNGKDMYNAT
jgi:hypothetical protein